MIFHDMNNHRILILNNDKLSQKSLYELLCRADYDVDIADSVEAAITHLNENTYQIVLADINEVDGAGLFKMIKERAHSSEVILLASYGNTEAAIESVRMGAFDYLVRPIEDKKIISTIERALAKKSSSQNQNTPGKKTPSYDSVYHGLIGKSAKMTEIYSLIDRISGSKATILLRGESGTGKRMIARAIHNADKKRRNKAFIEISCGALPREIIESELFGHTKGAFTGAIGDRKGRFELAHGGTMLLDDIDCFSADLQVKLLRVLQQKEFERVGDHKTIKVDVRIIASTNQNIEKAVEEKRFREDLYYRLNVISVKVPPLRDHKEDLSLLTSHFIKLFSKENYKKIDGASGELMDILMAYDWPGNIRELENLIERAVILDTDGVIGKNDLPEIILDRYAGVKKELTGEKISIPASLKDALQEPEKVYILQVLKESGWNKKKAAIKLGVNRTTLYSKLRKYDLLSLADKK